MNYEILRREMICSRLPTAMCHASTVLPLPDGTVLSAWFGGSYEGEGDTSIWTARRADGVWSVPVPIAHVEEPHWNPVLQRLPDGAIRLYYKVGAVIAQWRTMVCASRDGGRTWDIPRELVPGDQSGGRGPVRSKVIQLSSGRLLAPNSTELGPWTAYADRLDPLHPCLDPGAAERWYPDGPAERRGGVGAVLPRSRRHSAHPVGVLPWHGPHAAPLHGGQHIPQRFHGRRRVLVSSL